MSKHKQHDDADLVDALEHIIYEIWKYRQSVAYYQQILSAGGDAAIEFRVLHHRVLLEFFYGQQKHRDNIGAWEYIKDWKRTHDSASVSWLADYMKRCHTMLAHISKARSEIATRGLKSWGRDWPIVEAQVDKMVTEFLSALSTEHKRVCLTWIDRWTNGRHEGNDVLKSLVDMVNPPAKL